LPAASASGTGESGPVRIRPAAGLPLGLPPGLGTASGLGDTGGIALPPGRVSDEAHDIGQLAFPALDGQGTGPSPATAGAPENFSWLLHRQESTQNLSGLFMAQPTATLSVSTPTAELGTPSGASLPATTPSVSKDSVPTTAEAQFRSPGLLQTSLAAAGERHEAIGETLPQPLSPLSAQTSVGNLEPWEGLSGALLPLPPGASFPTLLHLHAQDDGLLQTAPATPWAAPATVPLTEAAVPLPTVPQTELAAASAALWPGALAPEDTTLLAYDAAPASRPLSKSQARTAATVPSVAPFVTDSALSLVSPRATSHTPAAEPALTVPPSQALEDLGRPWPRPLPANTMVLHLEPRELGALLLQVRVHDKHLIASFQAQSPEAETLLRTHLPSLHESLSQHGFEVQPIAISLTAEGFNAHMGAGTGAFAHQQHSAFQAFAQDQQAASARERQSEVDLQRTPRRPTVQRPRLLDVVI
jgi:hypothetical protein